MGHGGAARNMIKNDMSAGLRSGPAKLVGGLSMRANRAIAIRESMTDIADLLAAFQQRRARLGIIGLGYVGIPLALTAAKAGFKVLGFDIDEGRVQQINRGQSIIKHVSAEMMSEAVARGFEATADFARLHESDAILICVPTPLTKQREPDLSFVEGTARAIAPRLRKGQLIVLESTTYPGTTEEVLRPIFEETGLRSGVDFFLAFSPEREDPGNPDFATAGIPKVVGGDGSDALALANALYSQLVVKTVPVSSAATAEAVKLTENIFRAVNIALVNELKVVYAAMGIDVWEVIDAAKTKPFGFMPFYPGPGLGGHCIPIDPFYLTWKAREYDIATRFIELAGEINTRMPYYVVTRIQEAIDRTQGRGLSGASILLLGIAYKKNVDDMRESPSLKLIELLEARGAKVDYHDPFIPVIPMTREHAELAGRKSVALTPAALARYAAVLIATDHDDLDYETIVQHAKIVVDTRNACQKAGVQSDNIIKA
jgi:UDP-N-acetyl-D-glucosamine dehydrogenase